MTVGKSVGEIAGCASHETKLIMNVFTLSVSDVNGSRTCISDLMGAANNALTDDARSGNLIMLICAVVHGVRVADSDL